MKKAFIVLITLMITGTMMAQSPEIKFEKRVHDFGKIYEKDGRVTVKFNFTNEGDAPLVVSRVQASCGCTTPAWSREPVLPGESGFVTVSYNPYGRPGNFAKSILVHHNAGERPINLTIRGNTIPKSVVEK